MLPFQMSPWTNFVRLSFPPPTIGTCMVYRTRAIQKVSGAYRPRRDEDKQHARRAREMTIIPNLDTELEETDGTGMYQMQSSLVRLATQTTTNKNYTYHQKTHYRTDNSPKAGYHGPLADINVNRAGTSGAGRSIIMCKPRRGWRLLHCEPPRCPRRRTMIRVALFSPVDPHPCPPPRVRCRAVRMHPMRYQLLEKLQKDCRRYSFANVVMYRTISSPPSACTTSLSKRKPLGHYEAALRERYMIICNA